MRNALVEIWQVDNNGAYIHTERPHAEARQQLPGLRPVPDRLHRRVLLPHDQAGPLPRPHAAHPLQDQAQGPKELLTTQCYVKGEPANERDGIYRGIRDPKARETVTIVRADPRIADRRARRQVRRRTRLHARRREPDRQALSTTGRCSGRRQCGSAADGLGGTAHVASCRASFAGLDAVDRPKQMRVLHVEPLD